MVRRVIITLGRVTAPASAGTQELSVNRILMNAIPPPVPMEGRAPTQQGLFHVPVPQVTQTLPAILTSTNVILRHACIQEHALTLMVLTPVRAQHCGPEQPAILMSMSVLSPMGGASMAPPAIIIRGLLTAHVPLDSTARPVAVIRMNAPQETEGA